ncbi:MAG: serine hydrolase, partial [Bradyrhizobium sp.]|nr:serine hydrolase [Bradyrhizobium sp.]
MKRWRIEIIAARCLAAAALAILPVADGAHGVRAETASPVAGTLSPAALERIAGYIRNEISTGNIAGANILIHQHGKQVYFGSFGMRDAASGLP